MPLVSFSESEWYPVYSYHELEPDAQRRYYSSQEEIRRYEFQKHVEEFYDQLQEELST